ncbi:hypothetical protein LJC60_04090 [Ruminococcaceae bacterium OttesenSCG-928-D13]|nr:hypothetical protein [Ruminococcaceae bacterium OttesenSCG-928-D13]
MNYFEQELQKIVRCGVPFQSPTYAGSSCFGRLDGDLRVRLQFVTLGHADHYTALKATVINRKDGAVDSALFRFADILGNKQVSNPNFKNGVIPYVWTCNGQSEWYVYHPNQKDYRQLCEAVSDYCGVFMEQEMGGQGMAMSQQL